MSNTIQIVIVTIGEEFYGLDISRVLNLIEYTKPSVIPNKKKFVKGVIDLRGKIIPIIDLREILGYGPAPEGTKRKISIIQGQDPDLHIGLIVDDVLSTVDNISEEQVEPIDRLGVSHFQECIVAAIKLDNDIVAMLNVDKITEEFNK